MSGWSVLDVLLVVAGVAVLCLAVWIEPDWLYLAFFLVLVGGSLVARGTRRWWP